MVSLLFWWQSYNSTTQDLKQKECTYTHTITLVVDTTEELKEKEYVYKYILFTYYYLIILHEKIILLYNFYYPSLT